MVKFDDYRKDVLVKQEAFSEKVNTFSKRFDPIVERVTTEMAKLEQKFGKYESKLVKSLALGNLRACSATMSKTTFSMELLPKAWEVAAMAAAGRKKKKKRRKEG